MLDVASFEVSIESPSTKDSHDLLARSDDAVAERMGGTTDRRSASDRLTGPNVEFFVARLDGRAVGCVALVDQLYFGEIQRLYVDEEVRGTGVGAMLLGSLEAAAAEIGIRSVRMDVSGAPNDVMRFCQNKGYRHRLDVRSGNPKARAPFLEKRI